MSKNILMVPIQLNASFISAQEYPSVIEPMAEFSRFPYFDSERYVNPNVANISEEIVSQSFHDREFQLKSGCHLHWALPDALTRGESDSQGNITFPIVPDRWLIIRTKNDVVQKQWIVESDYLYSPGTSVPLNAIVYPYKDSTHPQPFRYMGRSYELETSITLDEWLQFGDNDSNEFKYLNKLYLNKLANDGLTAVGCGEPCLAAFYPNCHSIFSFYDNEPPTDLNGVQYYVIGKYSDIKLDCLRTLIINSKGLQTYQILQEVLQEQYKWSIDIKESEDDSTEHFPQRTLFYARLTFATGDNPQLNHSLEREKEAEYEKEFTAVSEGTIWIIRPETNNSDETIDRDDDETELTLPKELADLLNELNILQQKCDRDDDEIESLRKQLFDDWYQYMHKAYPSEGSRDDYPDLDEVKYFIEKYDLSPLNYRIKNNESLKLQCQNAIEELTNRLRSFNASNTQNNTAYILESIPALRYWLPNESVVLIANPTAKQTSQHRRDERLCKDDDLLECQIFQLNPPQDIAFIEAIDALNPNNNIGFSIWKEQPWHPLLLEWEIEDTSIQDRYEDIDAGYPLARNYGSRTIAENY